VVVVVAVLFLFLDLAAVEPADLELQLDFQ
jgi:hypothetical protein